MAARIHPSRSNFRSEEKNMQKRLQLALALFLSFAVLALAALAQQDKSKRPSPPASASCKFADGKTITVDYSSPRVKGRKIFGELVPYGKVWRAGANEATTFVPNTNVTVGGKAVPAGSYTIFTIPNEDKWTLIISKKTGESGAEYPGEADDFARVDMKSSKLAAPVENFTIGFDQAGSTCTMNLDWETTRASIVIAEQK
jgi:ABC-type phosphate transport system substrate-binding protein